MFNELGGGGRLSAFLFTIGSLGDFAIKDKMRCVTMRIGFAFVSSLGSVGGGLGNHKSSLSDLVTLYVTIQFEALFAIDDASSIVPVALRVTLLRQADMTMLILRTYESPALIRGHKPTGSQADKVNPVFPRR